MKKQEQPENTQEKPEKNEKQRFNFKALIKSKQGRIIAAASAVVIIVAILFAIPTTRYAALGVVVKRDVSIRLVDNQTAKPITDAEVIIGKISSRSDKDGEVTLSKIPTGKHKATVKKPHYKDASLTVMVGLSKPSNIAEAKLEATGRQVPIKVINKIGEQVVTKATVEFAGSSAITDDKGEAIIVVPADQTDIKGAVTADGFNKAEITLTTTEEVDPKNTFAITPSGKIYFLSRQTGKLNVMKSNLDGTDAQVVLEATGNEELDNTVLMASRDWKYVALFARREEKENKVYIIDTSTDKMNQLDETDRVTDLLGWSGQYLVYQTIRPSGDFTQDGGMAVKSFKADDKKITVLDQTIGGRIPGITKCSQYYVGPPILLDDKIIVSRRWDTEWYANCQYYHYNQLPDKKVGVYGANVDGGDKKAYIETEPFHYNFYRTGFRSFEARWTGSPTRVYTYNNGDFGDKQPSAETPSYKYEILSPSGNETLWSESVNGKQALVTGDKNGNNGKILGEVKDVAPYGWFTDTYLLVLKDGELHIINREMPAALTKITDFHQPWGLSIYNGSPVGY